MKQTQSYRYLIKNDACEFDLQQIFNQLSMFTLNPPEIPSQNQTLPPLPVISVSLPNTQQHQTMDQKKDLVQVLSDIKGLKNTLRYIKLNQRNQTQKVDLIVAPSKKQFEGQSKQTSIDRQLFIRPTQSVVNGPTTFWLVRGLTESTKQKLNLDSPTFVLTFDATDSKSGEQEQMLVAIQRKCLTLYQINNEQIQLKDFDSVSLEKKLVIIQIKHIQYEGKNYILIFGNEKDKKEDFFKCIVYEIRNQKFLFIKKNTLWKDEIYSPTILFESYPKNEQEKYCLIVGGCRDGKNVMFYQALQVDLHLMIASWFTYPIELTREIPFDTKRQTVLSGKAIKYNDFWYLFCTENQVVTQIKMNYQHGIWLENLQMSTLALELKEKIYFSENNLFLTLKGSLKLIMLNANLEFREKDFIEIVSRFDSY